MVSFQGDSSIKPVVEGIDKLFVIEPLEGGLYRDWHGDVHPKEPDYPRTLQHQMCLQFEYKIRTFEQWNGKLIVQIPTSEFGQQQRLLDFTTSTSADDIPFLKYPLDSAQIKGEV